MSRFIDWKSIKEAVEQAQRDIVSLGYSEIGTLEYEIKLSEKTTKWLGLHQNKGQYHVLFFNMPYMRICSNEEVLSTIYHEVAHSINGGSGHKGRWKQCANAITNRFGIPVSRLGYVPEYTKYRKEVLKEKRAQKTQYIPHCNNCGIDMRPYFSRTKAIQSIERGEKRFFCRKCNSFDLSVHKVNPQF